MEGTAKPDYGACVGYRYQVRIEGDELFGPSAGSCTDHRWPSYGQVALGGLLIGSIVTGLLWPSPYNRWGCLGQCQKIH